MSTVNGAAHTLGFKPQSVAGTPETTVNTFLSTEDVMADAQTKNIERKTFAGTGLTLPDRAGTIMPIGRATTEVHASQPHPWYWALGATTPTTVTTGVYKHVITDGGAPVRLTCEADLVYGVAKQGDVAISKLALSAVAGEIAMLDIEWMGMSHEDDATVTSTPAFTTDPLVLTNCSVVIDGSPDITIPELEIEWDGSLEQLRTLVGVANAPSIIRRKEPPKVNGKLKFVDFPLAELTKLRNASTFALVATFTGALITGAYYKYLKITLPACQYTGGLNPTVAGEAVTGEADFKAVYDTVTGKQITVEAQNTIATITG